MLWRFKTWLWAAGAVAVAVLGAYLTGRRDAGAAQVAQDARRRLGAMREAKEAEDEVEILDDVGLSDRAARWLRNDGQ